MSHHTESSGSQPLDLSRWRSLPNVLIVVGGVLTLIGFFLDHNHRQFGYSWLQAFMFFLSLALGGLGMVILHHLFDASWSLPIRRICEHMAGLLFPALAVLFLPILFLAPDIYEWIQKLNESKLNGEPLEHAISLKLPLFTMPGFYVVAIACFGTWWLLSNRLRYWSLKQDETGAAVCTHMMRRYSAGGVFLYALTLTMAAIMWMKALQHEWFSTMYGVQYFAASVWVTLFTVYFLAYVLKRQGPLREVATDKTFYFTGSLMFAFTVFYGYVTFFQYFIIWNANIPEETFWFVVREKGTWWNIGMIIIFGHFFLPFLLLLRIDVKVSKLWIMLPLGLWAWLMHFIDVSWNVMPALHKDNFHLGWLDLACFAFMAGVLSKIFLKRLNAHPTMPLRDPRFAEAMDIYVEPASYANAAGKSGGAH